MRPRNRLHGAFHKALAAYRRRWLRRLLGEIDGASDPTMPPGRRSHPSPAPSILVSNATTDAGIAAIRDLRNDGWNVEAFDTRSLPLGIRSRRIATSRRVSADGGPDHDRDVLALVCALRPKVLLPIGQVATRFACERAEQLRRFTRLNVPSLESFLVATNKASCARHCRRLGIETPLTYTLSEALERLGREGATMVVKPADNLGAATGVCYVDDAESLLAAVQRSRERFGETVIQDFIPGDVEAMRTLILLFGPETRLVAAFTTRKIRQWPVTGGTTVVSRSTAEKDLVETVMPFFEDLGWAGPAEVEFKIDSRDGRARVIEINARFPGYLRFARRCGLDMVALAAQLALDPSSVPSLPFPSYTRGRTYLNPGLLLKSLSSEDSGARLAAFRHGVHHFTRGFGHLVDILHDPLPAFGRAIYDAKLQRRPE